MLNCNFPFLYIAHPWMGHDFYRQRRCQHQVSRQCRGGPADKVTIIPHTCVFFLSYFISNVLHSSYFGSTGLDLNVARVSLGMSDLSNRSYNHVGQEGDLELATFQLQEEDTVYKV